jgi:endonuclease YncB( thermonuclease family)
VELVAEGHATVAAFDQDLADAKVYSKYYRQLLVAEEKACTKRVGIWKDSDASQSRPKTIVDRSWRAWEWLKNLVGR